MPRNEASLPHRLRNWALAHRWYASNGHCFSLEGRFRSNRGNEKEYDNGLPPPPPPPITIDVWDAWDVELAWRECTERARWCLKCHYHDRIEPRVACMLIRKHAGLWLRESDWRKYMRDARAELQRSLERPVRVLENWPRMEELAA